MHIFTGAARTFIVFIYSGVVWLYSWHQSVLQHAGEAQVSVGNLARWIHCRKLMTQKNVHWMYRMVNTQWLCPQKHWEQAEEQQFM